MPPPTNIIRIKRTIGRRVSPNVSRPLINGASPIAPAWARRSYRPEPALLRRDGQGVAQEDGSFGGDELARLKPFDDLVVAVAHQPDPVPDAW